MNLLKVLFVSWSLGVGLPYLSDTIVGYQEKCLTMSVSFFIMAVFCYRYISIELKLKNNINAYVISALCFCMVISSWFNFVFVSPSVYHILIDARRGQGFSWENIYKTVEIIALLTVGRNGLINIYNWFICGSRRHSVIIKYNSTHNTGI